MNRTAVVQIPEEQLDQVATSFIKAASGFSSQITIARGGHCVNAKSFLGFLSLMRDQGEVALTAEGPDAGEALDRLAQLCREEPGGDDAFYQALSQGARGLYREEEGNGRAEER